MTTKDVWIVEVHSPDAHNDDGELWHRMKRWARRTYCGINVCVKIEQYEMPDTGGEICKTCSDAVDSPPMRRTERPPTLPLNETLWHAFKIAYHQDHANASMHCAPVRYSPITFRLAEQINDLTPVDEDIWSEVYSVLLDMGAYEEDKGR